eukprot:TRINITY_DN6379_c0_g1_i1.p1 TRINITY_DN6379_c0_g1~~TRINITY_DN6379_c0_g1_i1.p1  ORF type:complete len:687 (+),score=125.36 TRINITY_DN6379_c0_g1_i1:17-2077(+)
MTTILERERNQSELPTTTLTYLLKGGRQKTLTAQKMRSLVENNPDLRMPKHELSRPDKIKWAAKLINRSYHMKKDIEFDSDYARDVFERTLVGQITGLGSIMQYDVFFPAFLSISSDEQLERWLPLAKNYQIIGCYAQTELGHGSNVRGLETTATYIREDDEFEIHSPTLTSTKWWVGQLGKLANHALVFANLIIDGKSYGIHSFLVQIRSLENHNSLPGVTVGDIGPKLGFNAIDNGYLRFDHFRIPRTNMLNRYSSVTPEGEYVKTGDQKMMYGGMLRVRIYMFAHTADSLSKALTIAIRYSAQRKQFGDDGNGEEIPVLNYISQQYRLFPYLGLVFGIKFTGSKIFNLLEKLESSDLSILPQLHAESAGLKSLSTALCAEAIQYARKACGGHGYSDYSGLPFLDTTFTHMETAEGENWIMTQQTARYLLKAFQKSMKGEQLRGHLSFLNDLSSILDGKCTARTVDDFFSHDLLRDLYVYRISYELNNVAMQMQEMTLQGMSQNDIWQRFLVDFFRLNKYFFLYVILLEFQDSIKIMKESTDLSELAGVLSGFYKSDEIDTSGLDLISIRKVAEVLENLCFLFGFFYLDYDLASLTGESYMNSTQVNQMRSALFICLEKVRPDAIALVDSFDHSDFDLGSAIGTFDGNVYENLYKMAREGELNKRDVFDGYKEYLRPVIQQPRL